MEDIAFVSHNCQFGLSQIHDPDKNSMTTLAKILPALASLKASGEQHVALVKWGIVSRKSCFRWGGADFGKGQIAKCDVTGGLAASTSRWWENLPSGSISQQSARAEKSRKLAEQFTSRCSTIVESWLQLGVTKTAMVYRLNGNEPQSHE